MILSSGMVIVRRENDAWKYLVLRAYKNWDFPKGVVEALEEPLETALREVKEETGITDLRLRWGSVFMESAPYKGSKGIKTARYYLAETTESQVVFSINPEIGMPEHHEYRWLTSEELLNLASPRLKSVIEWAGKLVNGNDFQSA
ncbi:MAG: NUDIX domain-containing protein [Deltaproteobacteria bacterium]|nr:NUDIX domain-containing protein [Deltaproteobacteria bacterium]